MNPLAIHRIFVFEDLALKSSPIRSVRAALAALLLPIAGCYHYRPQPLVPAAFEQQYRSRSLADPRLREFVDAQPVAKPPAWPPPELDLDTLTAVAFYFHPDLDSARARLAVAKAAVITASTKPNPTLSGGAGYTDSNSSPYLFRFGLDWPIETAGKRNYRTQRANQLTTAAGIALGEAAWQVRARVRTALLEHLLASREVQLLRREIGVRREAVQILEKRLDLGEASKPEVEFTRTPLALLEVSVQRATGLENETRAALESAVGLAPGALAGVNMKWPSLDQPPSEENVPLRNVQRAGLLNRLDIQRLLAEYAASESALQLEAARQYPDIRIVPGYSFGDGNNSYSLGPTFVLPLRDKNKGTIAEAEARRGEAAARFLAQQAVAIDQMQRTLVRYRAALAEFREADSALRNLLEDREKRIRLQLDAGEADRLALVSVRLESVTAERARLNALRAAQGALGALEDAVQSPLDSGAPLPAVPEIGPLEVRKVASR